LAKKAVKMLDDPGASAETLAELRNGKPEGRRQVQAAYAGARREQPHEQKRLPKWESLGIEMREALIFVGKMMLLPSARGHNSPVAQRQVSV
jgi:hypothetical protein